MWSYSTLPFKINNPKTIYLNTLIYVYIVYDTIRPIYYKFFIGLVIMSYIIFTIYNLQKNSYFVELVIYISYNLFNKFIALYVFMTT